MSTDNYERFLHALGKAVHDLRTENGLTQVELAKMASRSQSSIARVEGESPVDISLKIFFEIANGLSINLSELIKIAELQSDVHKESNSKKAGSTTSFWSGMQQVAESMPTKKKVYIQHMVTELVSGLAEV